MGGEERWASEKDVIVAGADERVDRDDGVATGAFSTITGWQRVESGRRAVAR